MISPLKSDKGKNQWNVPIKKKLRAPSIKKSLEIILCKLSFILIYLSLLGIWKECLMREIHNNSTKYAQAWLEGTILQVWWCFNVGSWLWCFTTSSVLWYKWNKIQMLPRPYVGSYFSEYFNGSYMEKTVYDLTTKIRQRKKSMKCTDKEEIEGSFN